MLVVAIKKKKKRKKATLLVIWWSADFWWLFPRVRVFFGVCSTVHSPLALLLLLLLNVEIRSRTLILLVRPGLFHIGSASWDDYGWRVACEFVHLMDFHTIGYNFEGTSLLKTRFVQPGKIIKTSKQPTHPPTHPKTTTTTNLKWRFFFSYCILDLSWYSNPSFVSNN